SAGALNADDAATGRRLWSAELAPGRHSAVFVSTAPAMADDVVYAGTDLHFGAFDLASGALLWSTAPIDEYDGPTTYTTPAVAGSQVFDGFGYGGNTFYSWDAQTGSEHWQVAYPQYFAVQVSPVISDGIVFNVNVDNTVTAYDMASGTVVWAR